jgi:hypothetical protein
MKQIVILLTFLPIFLQAQVEWTVNQDSIIIKTDALPGAMDHSIQFQNLDNLGENTYIWTGSGKGTFKAPYCNVRVSRTSFDSLSVATSEFHHDLQRQAIEVRVSAMPNRKALVEVTGATDYELRFRHISYGGWYPYIVGNVQNWPSGTHSGNITAFIPYRIMGAQIATVTVSQAGCTHTVGRLFYLN